MLDSTQFTGTERYELRECLGRGGMGTVYRAMDRESGAEVALKVLDNQAPEGLLRFKNEFRSVQAMRHRNLVRLGELGEADGQWFYTMELVTGIDLLEAISLRPADVRRPRGKLAGRRFELAETLQPGDLPATIGEPQAPRPVPQSCLFDEARLRRLLPQLATALAELHGAGKVHRDIKPSNILVTHEDRLVLLDFGMVYDTDRTERVTGSGVVVGTGAYMAPEQALGRDEAPGPAADWYAVGAILYELMAGRLPYEGSLLEVLVHKQKGPPRAPSRLAPGVPKDLETLCLALLEPDPDNRPTGEQVLAALGVRAPGGRGREEDDGGLFVGRDAETQNVVDTARMLTGPTTLILQGHSGVGKTAIVRRASEILQNDSSATVVLSGRCYERESVPFKGFDGILDDLTHWLRGLGDDVVRTLLPDHVGYLPLVFPSLRGVPAIAEIPPVDSFGLGQRELRSRVFDGLAQLLTSLAVDQAVVLHIDDTQWATGDTWAILEGLARSPHKPQVLILLTRRPPGEGDDPADVLGQFELIEIGALPANEAVELARRALEAHGGDPSNAAAIARDAAGHPMFIRQLARHLSRGSGQQQLSLDDIIRSDVSSLPAESRRALEVVCVAGVPLDQRTVALASGASLADFLADIAPSLVEANLVRTEGARASDTIEHFHDRVRESVLAGIETEALVRLHGRVGHALEQSGAADANPLLVVQHLLAAGRKQHAAHRAIEGAMRAAERLAFDRAAELLQLTLSLDIVDSARRRELQEDLANSLVNAGRGRDAADVYLDLADSADTAFERLERMRQAAEQLLFSGHLARGMVVLEDVLAEVGERLPGSQRSALWQIAKQRFLLRARGLRWKPRDQGDVRPRDGELLELYNAIAVGLSLVDHIRGAAYNAKHLRLALKIGTRDQVIRALAVEGVFVSSQGHRGRAERIADWVDRLAAESTHPHALAYAAFARAAPSFFIDNDWQTAHDLMVGAERHVRDGIKSTGWESDTAQAYQCFTRIYLGELRGLGGQVDRWVGEARRRGSIYGAVTLRARIIMPRLAADRPHMARVELDEAMSAWLPWRERYLVQHFYALHSHSELALYNREAARALDLHETQADALQRSMLLRVPIVRAEHEFARARLFLARAAECKGAERDQLLRGASTCAGRLRRSPVPAPMSWAQLVEATLAWTRGNREQALLRLKQSIDALRERSCHLYARGAELAYARAIGGTTGDTMSAEVKEWARYNDVVAVERFAAMIAPGWFDD